MTCSYSFPIPSLAEFQQLANAFANCLVVPMTIGLDGTLGAGKTQFTRFVIQALGLSPEEVTSPTFVLVHVYDTTPRVFHLDAYRIHDEDEFYELGVDEMFDSPALTVIEWSEKVASCLPPDRIQIDLQIAEEDQRLAICSALGPRSEQILHCVHNTWRPLAGS